MLTQKVVSYYRQMFLGNLPNDCFLKPNAIQTAKLIILKSHADGILPVHGPGILKIAHYRTGKLMPIRVLIVDTKNETSYHMLLALK